MIFVPCKAASFYTLALEPVPTRVAVRLARAAPPLAAAVPSLDGMEGPYDGAPPARDGTRRPGAGAGAAPAAAALQRAPLGRPAVQPPARPDVVEGVDECGVGPFGAEGAAAAQIFPGVVVFFFLLLLLLFFGNGGGGARFGGSPQAAALLRVGFPGGGSGPGGPIGGIGGIVAVGDEGGQEAHQGEAHRHSSIVIAIASSCLATGTGVGNEMDQIDELSTCNVGAGGTVCVKGQLSSRGKILLFGCDLPFLTTA
jgi:hypothetical protein